MADVDRPAGERTGGTGNTAIVAIVVIILLAVVAFFVFMRPGTVETQEGPDIELEVEPPATDDVPGLDEDGGGGGGGDAESGGAGEAPSE